MSDQRMPGAKNVRARPLLGLLSPLIILAEVEAEGKAKKARLRAQQVRMAKGKKGRLRAALRRLWVKIRFTKAYSEWIEVCRPRLGSRHPGPFHYHAPVGRPARQGESGDAVRPVSPKEKARRG